jgi:hypothetical protein
MGLAEDEKRTREKMGNFGERARKRKKGRNDERKKGRKEEMKKGRKKEKKKGRKEEK